MTFVANGAPHSSLVIAAAEASPDWENSEKNKYYQDDTLYRAWGKRIFDITLALFMLLAGGLLLLILMGLVALDGGKPLFAHKRVGQHGKLFKCLKIRSMRHGAEQQLAAILESDPAAAAEWAADHKLTNDPRVTRIGKFLRKSSLDELPQLVNVLRGEMSIVGPRPVTEEELARYGNARTGYFAMKPGLTGPWQVDGRNEISYEDRVALDVDYSRNYSFRRDLNIVAKTGFSVLQLTGK